MKLHVRSIAALLFIILCGIVLFSCKSNPQAVLRVGTNAEYPPFEYKKDNHFAGVDMDLIRLLAKKLNVKIEIVDMQFNSLIPALTSNKIDIAISAISISNERQILIDFSDPYYTANQVFIAPQDAAVTMNKLSDVSRYKLGTQGGTTGQTYIEKTLIANNMMPSENLKVYNSNRLAIQDMLDGVIDMVIIDDSAARGYASQMPIHVIFGIPTKEQYGIALPKKSHYLNKINSALGKIIASGEMQKIIQANDM